MAMGNIGASLIVPTKGVTAVGDTALLNLMRLHTCDFLKVSLDATSYARLAIKETANSPNGLRLSHYVANTHLASHSSKN